VCYLLDVVVLAVVVGEVAVEVVAGCVDGGRRHQSEKLIARDARGRTRTAKAFQTDDRC